MTDARLFGPSILLPCCGRPNFLPHRSPLGIFEHLESPPTDEWPITFLCITHGQLSEHSAPLDDYVDPTPHLSDLWRIECRCDRENCGPPRPIYTTYGESVPVEDLSRLFLRL